MSNIEKKTSKTKKKMPFSKRSSKFDLPKKIKIGYADFNISFFNKPPKDGFVSNMGETWVQGHNIRINENQNYEECVNTIIHEILHAISYMWYINFKTDSEEERIVSMFANALTTVFKDNPELIDWIKETFHTNDRKKREK